MHKNRRLFDLSIQNAQRKRIGEFLQTLPAHLHNLFDPTNRIFHPDVSNALASAVSRANDSQRDLPPDTATAKTRYTSSRDRALILLIAAIQSLPRGRYVLVLGGGNGQSFNSLGYWVSGQPGHYIYLPESADQITAVLHTGVEQLALSATDFDAATVLETVGGFLPEEPSANEVIFELTVWGLDETSQFWNRADQVLLP